MTNHNAFGHLLHSLWVCSGSYSTKKKTVLLAAFKFFSSVLSLANQIAERIQL